jgi:hypothetical protein
MSDILTRLEMAVAENNSAAIINLVKGEVMGAVGRTVIELPEKKQRVIYPIPPLFCQCRKGLLKCVSYDKTWCESCQCDLKDEQSAKDALERGKGNERNDN